MGIDGSDASYESKGMPIDWDAKIQKKTNTTA